MKKTKYELKEAVDLAFYQAKMAWRDVDSNHAGGWFGDTTADANLAKAVTRLEAARDAHLASLTDPDEIARYTADYAKSRDLEALA
jgi:hypothetical protein